MSSTKNIPALIILSDEDDWSLDVVMRIPSGFLVYLSDFPSNLLPELIRDQFPTTSGFFCIDPADLKHLLIATINADDLRYVFGNNECLLSQSDDYLEPDALNAKRPEFIRALTAGL